MRKYFAKRELQDCDKNNQLIVGYPNIPAGAEVIVNGYTQEHLTRYANVFYNGQQYYVFPEDIEEREIDG